MHLIGKSALRSSSVEPSVYHTHGHTIGCSSIAAGKSAEKFRSVARAPSVSAVEANLVCLLEVTVHEVHLATAAVAQRRREGVNEACSVALHIASTFVVEKTSRLIHRPGQHSVGDQALEVPAIGLRGGAALTGRVEAAAPQPS